MSKEKYILNENLVSPRTATTSSIDSQSLFGNKTFSRLVPYVFILTSIDATSYVPVSNKSSLQAIVKRSDTKKSDDRTSIIEYLWENPIQVENFKPLTRDEIYER